MRTLHSRLILLTALLSATQGMAADRHRVPPPVEMQEPARAQYLRILAALDAEGRLDDDKPALERVARILSGLVTAIPAARAEAGDWSWEAHVTSDARIDAFGMPGGKLIVGSRFVARLELDDAELATLIAHEMAHVIAGHRRPPHSDSMEMDVSERLRMRGWQVPAYTFPADMTDTAVMRIVVRNGFSMDLANLLLDDLRLHVRALEHHPQTQPPPEIQRKRQSFRH